MKLRIALLTLLLLFSFNLKAQTDIDYLVGAQIGTSFNDTKAYNASLMFGIQSDIRDQLLFGGVVKQITTHIGHKQTYFGIRGHVQSSIGSVAPFLSYEFMRGEYYIYEHQLDKTPEIKTKFQGQGTIGVGYMVNEFMGIFAGYTFMDYNPVKFIKTNKSPYKDSGINIKLSFNLPVGYALTTTGIGQRRMW